MRVEAGRGRRRRLRHRQARVRRDQGPGAAQAGGQRGPHRTGRSARRRRHSDRGDGLVRWRAVRRMALGAAQTRRRPARGPQPRRRRPGGPDRVAETRPDRRHQRRPRPGHLQQVDRRCADDRAVGPGRVLRAVEDPGHHDRPGGVQARRDAGAGRHRRGEVRRRRHQQPPVRRQEGPAAGRAPREGRSARGHARLAHRLPHPDGVRHRRHRRRLDTPRPDARCARLRRRPDLDDRERRGPDRSARRPGRGGAGRQTQRLHRQGTRRRDRVRVAVVVSAGSRPAAGCESPARWPDKMSG